MESFSQQLISKLLSSIIFFLVMIFISACFLTGEFPPRFQSVKAQYQSFLELKQNYAVIMKNASERLQKPPVEPVATSHSSPEISQALQLEIKELRVEQLRLQSQVETLIQQNREIIKALTAPR